MGVRKRRPAFRLTVSRVMGGLWTRNCQHRTDQGPPITDLELPHWVRNHAGLLLQARMPTFCPAKRAPPSPASPPEPCVGAACWRGWVGVCAQILGAGIRWISWAAGPCGSTPSCLPHQRGGSAPLVGQDRVSSWVTTTRYRQSEDQPRGAVNITRIKRARDVRRYQRAGGSQTRALRTPWCWFRHCGARGWWRGGPVAMRRNGTGRR